MERTDKATADLEWVPHINGVDAEFRECCRETRLLIESCPLSDEDRDDIVDSWRRFSQEMSRAEPHAERLERYWRRIDEISPSVSHRFACSPSVRRRSETWFARSIRPRGGFVREREAADLRGKIDDPKALLWIDVAYTVMINLSRLRGFRPEGAFDLCYFYTVLLEIFRRSDRQLFEIVDWYHELLEQSRLRQEAVVWSVD
jgi:hypothetical protein